MPAEVAEIRREICARCDDQCIVHLTGSIDHANPSASCPRAWSGRWGCYGRCGDPAVSRATLSPLPPRQSFSLPHKARRLTLAVIKWAKVGFALISSRDRLHRRAICGACPAYRPAGNLWLGECTDIRCGCTRFKQWLPTETCPRGKWPVLRHA